MKGGARGQLAQKELFYPRFSEREYARRYALVKGMMKKKGLDALLVFSSRQNDGAVNYLTNFMSGLPTYLLFPLEGEPVLVLHFYNHIPCAQAMSIISEIEWNRHDPASYLVKKMRQKRLDKATIGVTGLRGMPYQDFQGVTSGLPRARFVDVSSDYNWIRWIRSDEELEWYRKGAHFADLTAEALECSVRPGLTGHDLSAICYEAVLREGGRVYTEQFIASTSMKSPTIFVPWMVSLPHVLSKGDVVITELTASYFAGYTGQIHRPYAVASAPTRLYRRLFDVALDCYERVAKVLRPGATTEDVLEATSVIEENGFTVYDSLLHQEGGANPELGSRSSVHNKQRFTFKENMVYVIQPQPITKDRKAGLQLGSTVVIRSGGAQNLCTYPLKFPVCGAG